MPSITTSGRRATSSSGITAALITAPPATTRRRRTASIGACRSTISVSKRSTKRRNNGAAKSMSITVTPFEGAGCGADISGVDIREPLSPADRDAIRQAWLDHLVLRFRNQPMTDEQHMAFTRQFGELEFNPAKLIEKQ